MGSNKYHTFVWNYVKVTESQSDTGSLKLMLTLFLTGVIMDILNKIDKNWIWDNSNKTKTIWQNKFYQCKIGTKAKKNVKYTAFYPSPNSHFRSLFSLEILGVESRLILTKSTKVSCLLQD